MKKHLFFLVLALFAGIHTASASSGTCGEHLTWNLNDGVLIIDGTGDMTNYEHTYIWPNTPWSGECSSIKSVIITSRVTSIGNNAFYGCSSLTTVIIPNSVTSIGNYAFYNCNGLTSVTIPNSVTSIGNSAFYNCSGLTSVTIPNSVTRISKDAFYDCSGLTSVTIPNSVTSIGDYAFYRCRDLDSVSISNSVTSIGSLAFGYCKVSNLYFSGSMSDWLDKKFDPSYISESYTLYINHEIVRDIEIPNIFSNICDNAFNGCSGLTSVTIPNSVTSIGNAAFSKCSGLTSVTIPNSVTSIGGSAFSGCSGLTSVSIPNSVTSIGGSAFSGCSGLTSVSIPNSVTSIGDYAFYRCRGLDSVSISNSVTSIGSLAFGYCKVSNLYFSGSMSDWLVKKFSPSIISKSYTLYINNEIVRDVEIPSSISSIGSSAFSGCSGLTSVAIPNSVTSIGGYAFYGCTGLTSVIIPNSVTSIGDCAFYGCSGLTSVTIPNSVTSIGSSAFYNVQNIIYSGTATGSPWEAKNVNGFVDGYLVYYDESKTELVGCSSAIEGDVTIPNSVIFICYYAFENCNGLTSILIPNSVTYIFDGAFKNCSGLTSVVIPNSVTSIYCNAFSGCSGLTSVVIPNSVTSIDCNAFSDCSGLTSVTIPNSVTSIGSSAFSGCSGLTSVTIPNSITSIGSDAFSGCSGLTSVTISSSVTSIGNNAFKNCKISSLYFSGSMSDWYAKKFSPSSISKSYTLYINNEIVRDIEIPDTAISISYDLFYGCSSLSSVTIPNSVIYIESSAFYNCSGLTSVTIPNSIKSISENAFYNVLNIIYNGTATGSPWGALSVNGYVEAPLVYNDESKTELRVCFRNYKGDVTIPNSVTTIGDDAFYDCSGLTSVTIPNSVTSIGDDAFNGCSGLTTVTIPNSVTRIGGYAFYGCSGLTSVTIGSGVKYIGGMCFSFDEDKLPVVTCYSPNVPIVKKTVDYVYDPFGIYTIVGDVWDFTWDNYSLLTVYVPASSVDDYKADEYWGLYNIQPIEAEQLPTDNLVVESTTDAVEIMWPKVKGAATYELKIADKDEQEVCTLIFNDAGQLQTIAFRAPAIDGHRTPQEESQGFRFTITGLTENTNYALTIVAKDENGEVLSTEQKSFKTKKTGDDGNVLPTYTITFVNYDNTELLTLTEVEEGTMPVYTGDTPTREDDAEFTYTFSGWTPEIVAAEADAIYTATYTATPKISGFMENINLNMSHKIFENGHVYILMPDGKRYDVSGVEIKL